MVYILDQSEPVSQISTTLASYNEAYISVYQLIYCAFCLWFGVFFL